ncbi:hypothetical protein Acr_17g0005470 [Actinidia rufa]|uniref:Uncharacterized protein n=1 Tax=Actinidia rufa TaxID=165716 RepID=A0A7J0G2G4_9ERIC|nr:hypothetical protein Acr_17g0005470 [Actinidia rufa]
MDRFDNGGGGDVEVVATTVWHTDSNDIVVVIVAPMTAVLTRASFCCSCGGGGGGAVAVAMRGRVHHTKSRLELAISSSIPTPPDIERVREDNCSFPLEEPEYLLLNSFISSRSADDQASMNLLVGCVCSPNPKPNSHQPPTQPPFVASVQPTTTNPRTANHQPAALHSPCAVTSPTTLRSPGAVTSNQPSPLCSQHSLCTAHQTAASVQPPSPHHQPQPSRVLPLPLTANQQQPPLPTPLCRPTTTIFHHQQPQTRTARPDQTHSSKSRAHPTFLCSPPHPCAAHSRSLTQPQSVAAQPSPVLRGCPNSYGPEPVLVSLSHSQLTQRVTSVLLNGKNFHAWSRSFQLYPSGKRKTRWILGKEPKPVEAPTALHGKSGHPTWILDSGANNHMTGELATFISPMTSINQSVCIADRSSIPIRSQGDARLSSDITLSSVYHVPHFAYNLLFVSRLAKDLNCAVVFLPSRCYYLQNLSSKKIFGRGYERDGLYYFGDPLPSFRCLLRGMGVLKYFWHMVVRTATYLINWTPSRVLQGKAPLHILQPTSTLFPIIPRVFGCTCFVQNRSLTRTKLDDKAVRCIFLGYSSMSKGYRCYDPVTRYMYHSLDVTVLKTVPFFSDSTPSPDPGSEILAADDPIPPCPLPILEPPSSPPTPNGSLPPFVSQDPSPRAQAPLPASSLESGMSPPLVF